METASPIEAALICLAWLSVVSFVSLARISTGENQHGILGLDSGLGDSMTYHCEIISWSTVNFDAANELVTSLDGLQLVAVHR